MKRSLACVRLATLAVLSIATLPAQAQTRCAEVHLTPVETVACAKAKESITALRQYAWRTRMIHNLYLPHYAPPQASPSTTRTHEGEARKDERQDVASMPR